MRDECLVRAFLRYGYYPDQCDENYRLDFPAVDRSVWSGADHVDLIRDAASTFKESVHGTFKPGERQVLPISGGLDSRALLGVLLECTDAGNLHTYTYGLPGTHDYEIGNALARRYRTDHTQIDLSEVKYGQADMLHAARRTGTQAVLFHHPPAHILDDLSEGGVIWSGYVGDGIAGGFVPDDPLESLEAAQNRYLTRRRFVTSCDISGLDDEAIRPLLARPRAPCTTLSYHEQLLYDERVAKMISPQIMWRGYTYRTPFINNPFMAMMLGLEDHHRRGQRLYRAMLLTTYPELFELPTTGAYGLSLRSGNLKRLGRRVLTRIQRMVNRWTPRVRPPHLNYMDFAWAIRERDDIRTIVHDNIMDLKSRGIVPWVDIDRLWARHQSLRANHADALLVLASLELITKASAS